LPGRPDRLPAAPRPRRTPPPGSNRCPRSKTGGGGRGLGKGVLAREFRRGEQAGVSRQKRQSRAGGEGSPAGEGICVLTHTSAGLRRAARVDSSLCDPARPVPGKKAAGTLLPRRRAGRGGVPRGCWGSLPRGGRIQAAGEQGAGGGWLYGFP